MEALSNLFYLWFTTLNNRVSASKINLPQWGLYKCTSWWILHLDQDAKYYVGFSVLTLKFVVHSVLAPLVKG